MTYFALRQFVFPNDYAEIFALWQNAGEGLGVGPSDLPEEIKKKCQRDPDLFLVAECEGCIVGSVIGGFDGRRGMIYHLAVAPDVRRQGLANRLMEEIELRLRQKGCRKAYLLVKKGNDVARFLYEGRGWAGMGETVDLFGKDLV
jgi:ribosomal protein S18 acetylase RimI-like enzyme